MLKRPAAQRTELTEEQLAAMHQQCQDSDSEEVEITSESIDHVDQDLRAIVESQYTLTPLKDPTALSMIKYKDRGNTYYAVRLRSSVKKLVNISAKVYGIHAPFVIMIL